MVENNHGSPKRLPSIANLLETAVEWAEAGVALVLALVIVAAIVSLIVTVFGGLLSHPSLEGDGILKVVKAVLDVFILIELFRITLAYVRQHDIIPTVLETALVVAAREVVVVEAGKDHPLAGAVVALTLVAVSLAWFLLRRAGGRAPQTRTDQA